MNALERERDYLTGEYITVADANVRRCAHYIADPIIGECGVVYLERCRDFG